MSMLVTAVGNLVTDPKLRFSKDGKGVCNFRIACDTGKDKPSIFKDCVCFSYLAENVAVSLLQGDRTIVKGRMETQQWTKDGKDYSKDVIIAEDCGPSLLFAEAECKRKKRDDYSGNTASSGKGYDKDVPLDDNDFPQ